MLHETTRKWICRRLFVACCLTPTLWVVGAVGYYHRPWRLDAVNQQLSGSLRAKVSVGQAWQPRPGVMQYRTIQVRDSRRDLLILAADSLQVDRHFGARTFQLDQVELPQAGLHSLMQLLETWLVTSDSNEIHFQIDRVVIHRGQISGNQASDLHQVSDVLNLENLQLHGEPGTDQQGQPTYQVRGKAEYRVDGQGFPLRLTLKRQFTEDNPHLKAELDLRLAPLPGWALQNLVPGGPIFKEARFHGVIQWETDLQHTHGLLLGQHADLQLQHLLSHGSQHEWSGHATIDWDQFRWQDGRVVEARGLLRSSRGTASRSLLVDAVKLLFCKAAVEIRKPIVTFDELACRFQLGADGLILWGECQLESPRAVGQTSPNQPTSSRCLLALQGRPLLLQSDYIVPVAQLVRLATSPTHSWTLPATREAQRLAQVLPLP